MQRSNTQFERQVEIDRRIREGAFPSVAELAVDFEVSERTIKRDIEFMRDRLGAPIEYDRTHRGYYYREPIWSFPALSLRDGELMALLLARRALEQYRDIPQGSMLSHFFEQMLAMAGKQGEVDAEHILQKFSFIAPPSLPLNRDIWDQLCSSMLHFHTVEADCESHGCERRKLYRIDPLHIANIEGEWCLFARSHHGGQILKFAISHMKAVKDTGECFVMSPDFHPEELIIK
jgi:predicted DNA-binding transcriptional regulator YafY